jgi:hypothetical protein
VHGLPVARGPQGAFVLLESAAAATWPCGQRAMEGRFTRMRFMRCMHDLIVLLPSWRRDPSTPRTGPNHRTAAGTTLNHLIHAGECSSIMRHQVWRSLHSSHWFMTPLDQSHGWPQSTTHHGPQWRSSLFVGGHLSVHPSGRGLREAWLMSGMPVALEAHCPAHAAAPPTSTFNSSCCTPRSIAGQTAATEGVARRFLASRRAHILCMRHVTGVKQAQQTRSESWMGSLSRTMLLSHCRCVMARWCASSLKVARPGASAFP